MGCADRDERSDECFGEVEGRLQDEEESEHHVTNQAEDAELAHLAEVDAGDAHEGEHRFGEAENVDVHPRLGRERRNLVCRVDELDRNVGKSCIHCRKRSGAGESSAGDAHGVSDGWGLSRHMPEDDPELTNPCGDPASPPHRRTW